MPLQQTMVPGRETGLAPLESKQHALYTFAVLAKVLEGPAAMRPLLAIVA